MNRLTALGLMTLVLLLGGGSAEAAFRRADCWFGVPEGERATCGRVDVPAAPPVPAASLPVAILHANTPGPADDAVLYIEGGPGASPFGLGEDTEERMEAWWEQTEALRRTRDVILFDPRGVGRATPAADCPELDRLASEPAAGTARRNELEAAAVEDCARRIMIQGVDPATLTTPRAAADAFAVASAVGAKSVDLWAVSYGTRVAFAMLRQPQPAPPIRAIVLDGVYPPDANPREEAAWLAQRGMRRLFEDCAANRVCRAAHPDFEERFAARIGQLDAKPAEIRTASAGAHLKLTGGLVLDALLTMLTQADELTGMPGVIERVIGDRYLQLLPWLRSPWFGDPDTADGLAMSIECRETVNAADPKQTLAGLKRWAPYGAVAADDPGPRLCANWPTGASAAGERLPVASPVPALLLSGAYDAVTPPEWGDRAAATLPKSRHVVFRGLGHIVTLSRSCPMRMVADFLATPDPAALTVCPEAAKPPAFTAR
jgi:pimeloyl-ACP methyl ester carboxylesterase